jgi:hypothetical protein
LQLIFYSFYIFLSALPSLPLDMLGGLALPTRRSLDMRVPVFVLCNVPLPLEMLRGLGHSNIRVAKPEGSYFSSV